MQDEVALPATYHIAASCTAHTSRQHQAKCACCVVGAGARQSCCKSSCPFLCDLLFQVCYGPHLEAYEQGRMGLSQRCEVSASQLERLFTLALLHQLLELAAAGRDTESVEVILI